MSEPDELFMTLPPARPFVTVTHGLRGHFAVLMYYDEAGGYWEPWQSGIGSYKDRDGAAREAREWAEAEELECKI